MLKEKFWRPGPYEARREVGTIFNQAVADQDFEFKCSNEYGFKEGLEEVSKLTMTITSMQFWTLSE